MAEKFSKDTIVGHLTELRKRLVIIFVVNILVSLLCFQYSDIIVQYLLYLNPGVNLVYIKPSELFMVYIKISFICGIILCFPLTVFEIWTFVSKGLYKKEKYAVVFSLVAGTFFFALGAYFCYEVVLPTTLSFFMRLETHDINAMLSIESFMSFCNTMLLCFGAVFEMPVIVFMLSMLNILKPKMILDRQGYLILIIFIVAAIVTPPDVVSQILLAIPMVLLLELSIGICWLIDKVRTKKVSKEANQTA